MGRLHILARMGFVLLNGMEQITGIYRVLA